MKIKSLYNNLKLGIMAFSSLVHIKPNNQSISFVHNKIFVDIVIWKHSIDIFLNLKKGALNDPLKISKDVSNVGHRGHGEYLIKAFNCSNLDYILFLVKQSFEAN
jgi:predicted transport protein